MVVNGSCSGLDRCAGPVKVKKNRQFIRKFWLFYKVQDVGCTYFILECLKILKSQDHVSPAGKPISAN